MSCETGALVEQDIANSIPITVSVPLGYTLLCLSAAEEGPDVFQSGPTGLQ